MSNQSASGLSLLDSSQLSVCQKITMYFEHQQKVQLQKQQHQQQQQQQHRHPTSIASKSASTSSSSNSSASLDLDASFQQLLANHKRVSSTAEPAPSADTSCEQSSATTCIDLCSPVSEHHTPQAPAPSASLPPGQLDASRWLDRSLSLLDIDDSLDVDQLDDNRNLDDDAGEDDCAFLNDSDESFLEHERRCQLSPPAQPDVGATSETRLHPRLLNFNGCADETQLADVEAPSNFWDCAEDDDSDGDNDDPLNAKSIVPMPANRSLSLAGRRSTWLPVRSRISTIPEESTIDSSSNSALSSRQSHNSSGGHSSGGPRPAPAPAVKPRPVEAVKPREHDLDDFFQKRQAKRNFYAYNVLSTPSNGVLTEHNERVQRPAAEQPIAVAPFKRLSGGRQVPNNRPVTGTLPHSPAKPLPRQERTSGRRESKLFTPPAAADDRSDAGEFEADADDLLDTALPRFNDTIEAMDYYMAVGRQLNDSPAATKAAAQTPVVSPVRVTSPPVAAPTTLACSPSLKNRTPDTIRRRLLMRNFLRSSGASPQFGDCVGLNETLE